MSYISCVFWLGLVFGDRAKETERVMNALFTEESIMLFHRVSCEMAYADQIGGNQLSNNQPSRDIIVVEDDDDDVMHDANNVNLETGENSNALGGMSSSKHVVDTHAIEHILFQVRLSM